MIMAKYCTDSVKKISGEQDSLNIDVCEFCSLPHSSKESITIRLINSVNGDECIYTGVCYKCAINWFSRLNSVNELSVYI